MQQVGMGCPKKRFEADNETEKDKRGKQYFKGIEFKHEQISDERPQQGNNNGRTNDRIEDYTLKGEMIQKQNDQNELKSG
jgi:hypothetical protein